MRHFVLFIGLLVSLLAERSYAQLNYSSGKRSDWVQLPYDRMIKPAGKLIILGDSAKESHALDCALSPDKKWLVVQERYSIVFISTGTKKIIPAMYFSVHPSRTPHLFIMTHYLFL